MANAHTWAPGVLDKDGKLDSVKFIEMLHGTTDVKSKLDAMSGLSHNMRKKIDDQYRDAIEAGKDPGEAAKSW